MTARSIQHTAYSEQLQRKREGSSSLFLKLSAVCCTLIAEFKLWLMRTLLASMSVWLLASAWFGTEGLAQSSSLFRRADANLAPLAMRPANMNGQQMSTEPGVSYFTVKPLPKKIYKVGDLITVIVRQKSQYTNDGISDLKRDMEYKANLKDWIHLRKGNLVPDTQPAGDPKIGFTANSRLKGDGQMNRTNEMITRITCQIIDILPNGCLVLQGGTDIIETDGEIQTLTLTGTCRSEDIMVDNTILSTQIYMCKIKNNNSGAVKDNMKRGWLQKAWDFAKPL
ncbi:MAG: flagellar basal body L-ring protein FlgH [Phycisphaerae bacterium]